MSNKIVDTSNEINVLSNKLEGIHIDTIENMNKLLNQIAKINTKEGGVFSDSVTKGINSVADLIKGQIIPSMQQVFSTGEQMLSKYIESISNCDNI